MKNIVSFIFSFLILTSCTNYGYMQVYEVQSKDCIEESDLLVYNNNDCRITYNFWAEGGNGAFTFLNKTDKDIYMIMPLSLFLQNGEAIDYNSMLMLETGYTEAHLTANSICIPSKSWRSIKGFALKESVWIVCDDDASNYPRQYSAKIKYTKENTPLTFINRIAYCLEKDLNNVKYVNNIFWISSLQNYKVNNSIVEKYKDCENGYTVEKERYKMMSPSRFFNKYQKSSYSSVVGLAGLSVRKKNAKGKASKTGNDM